MVDKRLFLSSLALSGMNQRELAKAAKISLNTLNAKLNGHRNFDTMEIKLIAEALGIHNDGAKVAAIFLA